MGAVDFWYKFEHYDWRMGISELKDQAEFEHGHEQGYSGDINSVSDFSIHNPNRSFRNQSELEDYVDNRIANVIRKGKAELINLGIVGYSIAKAVVVDYQGSVNFNLADLKNTNAPAILVDEYGFVKARGTVADLKERGKGLVLREKFKKDYYIIGKNTPKIFLVTGEGQMVKKTSRKSNGTTLVLPYYQYIVYGSAPS